MSAPIQEKMLRPSEVAEMLGIATRTLWKWRSEGRLPEPIRMNRKVVRWLASDIDSYLHSQKGGER